MTNLRIVTPATVEPVTLAAAKAHLKIDYDANDESPPVAFPDDALIEALIVSLMGGIVGLMIGALILIPALSHFLLKTPAKAIALSSPMLWPNR